MERGGQAFFIPGTGEGWVTKPPLYLERRRSGPSPLICLCTVDTLAEKWTDKIFTNKIFFCKKKYDHFVNLNIYLTHPKFDGLKLSIFFFIFK